MSVEPPDDRPPRNGHDPFGEQADSGEPKRPPLTIEWAHDIAPRESSWTVKGILPAAGIAAIYGPSRAGKSFVAIDWAMRIACGESVMTAKTRRRGVAYVAGEASNGVRKRICAWRQEHGRDDGEFIPFALIASSVDISDPDGAELDELIALLEAERVEFRELGEPLGVVIIDTMAACMVGCDENSGVDMGRAVKALQRIADELSVLVVAVHHTGKNLDRGARGHSSFFASLDCAIELVHDEDTGARSCKLAKQKDGDDGKAWGFKLRQIEIGTDNDGDATTSCTVVYLDTPSAAAKRGRGGEQEIVLNAIRAALSTHGEKAAHGVPAPPGVFVAPYAEVRQRALDAGLCDSGETSSFKRKAFFKAVQALKKSGRIDVFRPGDDGCFWLL